MQTALKLEGVITVAKVTESGDDVSVEIVIYIILV